MSTTEQYYKAIADYGGVEGDANYIPVMKDDKVRLIKKDKEWFTVEKDGRIGKVPKGILIQKGIKITQIPMNLPIQTAQPSPQIMNSMSTQNDKEPIKYMIPIDKQKSQIIPPGQKEQTEQQSDNLLQSITNPKSHSDPVYEWKTRIPDQIMKIVKERICPLIHLNCPPEINCQQCINIPHSPALQELKSAVFQTLAEDSNDNSKFKDILLNDPNIIPHLTHPLIYQKNDQLTLTLRRSSRGCLFSIHCRGDASVQSELVNTRYVRALVIAISTAGGSGEEQDYEIFYGLYYIYEFLSNLRQGRNYKATFPPQPLLARRSVEQIEEEGGNEEIDSQLINKKNRGQIKVIANYAKGWILNYFIEYGNTRLDWYW
ncbi:MAG: hypothetical protein EZS28_008212 [Streblomastix strix]|uniref:SH3 domain-containing protein n=1 Tax=Streblomastix strix TaxID=222440 RepID=A0A5J4WN76_9EUKA|nr:MAG: hypothetical protein EZS28_008212 [Streblomastix strix]